MEESHDQQSYVVVNFILFKSGLVVAGFIAYN